MTDNYLLLAMLALLFLLIIVIAALITASRRTGKRSQTFAQFSYEAKPLLTDSERIFIEKLKPLENYGFNIIPQVPLSSVIRKTGHYRYQNELYRTIDFGIFDRDYHVLLLIELNDASHERYDRHQRDLKVRKICQGAQIELLAFHASYPNDQAYVLHRVMDKIRQSGAEQI
ncbi:MAG: DUF2726 domain-containing protein [Candidatus Nanoperiomorbaceae bacterium]